MYSVGLGNVSIELTDSLAYKWKRIKNTFVRGYAFYNNKFYDAISICGELVNSRSNVDELIYFVKGLSGSYTIIHQLPDGGFFLTVDIVRSMPLLVTQKNSSIGGADEILDPNKVNNRRRSRTCIPTKNGLRP